MALEVVYEGIIAVVKNVDSSELASATAEIIPGRICCLELDATKAANTVYFGDSAGTTLLKTRDMPFGLCADYKDDVIASGKVSVYFTAGLYLTDQVSGTPTKGNPLTFDTDGKLKTAVGGDYLVGICTEAAGDDGFIEILLNVTGNQMA